MVGFLCSLGSNIRSEVLYLSHPLQDQIYSRSKWSEMIYFFYFFYWFNCLHICWHYCIGIIQAWLIDEILRRVPLSIVTRKNIVGKLARWLLFMFLQDIFANTRLHRRHKKKIVTEGCSTLFVVLKTIT